ncbi:MAG: amidohydrolase family protein, partial [Emcibacteraceae bacterium]|nr:amidohydrolase family protein [Emcibacteraceae bacterium]
MKKVPQMLILLLVSTGLLGCSNSEDSNLADVVYLNGDIYTSDDSNPNVSAVAVTGKSFVYAGDDASAFIGPETQIHDLGGQMVIPGIVDSHSHPGWVALSFDQLLLDEAATKPELLAAIEKLVAENPNKKTLLAGYWHNDIFGVEGPHKDDLDKIEPNRPLIILDDWGHTVWANSAALANGGITRDTKDPVPGFSFYQKDNNGDLTGWITESAASDFLNSVKSVDNEVEAVLMDYLNYYQTLGVTTVFDGGNFGLDREMYAAISRMDKAGTLPVRYHGSYTLFLPDDLSHAVDTLAQLGQDFNSDNVRIDTLKLFFDGVLETRTAAMSYDYLDAPG